MVDHRSLCCINSSPRTDKFKCQKNTVVQYSGALYYCIVYHETHHIFNYFQLARAQWYRYSILCTPHFPSSLATISHAPRRDDCTCQ